MGAAIDESDGAASLQPPAIVEGACAAVVILGG